MKRHVPLLLALLTSALLVVDALGQSIPDAKDSPKETFAKHCASCHTNPDARFATDRAWLDRVLLTA